MMSLLLLGVAHFMRPAFFHLGNKYSNGTVVQSPNNPSSAVQLPNKSWYLITSDLTTPYTIFHLDFNAYGLKSMTGNGGRHLMEHLLAYGKNDDLETRLESEGGFLTLRTYRTGLDIEIDLPNDKWKRGFAYLQEIVSDQSSWTPANISGEKTTIKQEIELETPPELAFSAAWKGIFGDDGADPIGDPSLLGSIDLADLKALVNSQLIASRAALTASTSIAKSEVEPMATAFLEQLPKGEQVDLEQMKSLGNSKTITFNGQGSARAAVVNGIQVPGSLEMIAAALAIASQCEGAYFEYSPSSQMGVILVGANERGTVESVIDGLSPEDTNRLFVIGRDLLAKYLRREISGGSREPWMGLLLSQEDSEGTNQLLDRAMKIQVAPFAKALSSFESPLAWELVGK